MAISNPCSTENFFHMIDTIGTYQKKVLKRIFSYRGLPLIMYASRGVGGVNTNA